MLKASLLGLLIVSGLIIARAVVRVVWESRPRVWRVDLGRDVPSQCEIRDRLRKLEHRA